jgi:hypothetical protein
MRQLKLPWMSVPDQQRMLDMVGGLERLPRLKRAL